MIVQVHAFDWAVYAEPVMPAFARWLINKDETSIYQLFERTRCAMEEQYLPEPMRRLRVWPRAKSFVEALPRGPHSRKEYSKICSAEQFTSLSDQYLHHHTPHLYQNSPALRTVWGAVIEEYCLPWLHTAKEEAGTELFANQVGESQEGEQPARGELVSLLQAAGLVELAREVGEQAVETEPFELEEDAATGPGAIEEAHKIEAFDLYADEENPGAGGPQGIILGQHPNTLRLRGWLAGISTRAMALFEYLACGRRRMPFGYEPGEPYGAYCGYLTPDETWQLTLLLQDIRPPGPAEAEEDYQRYSVQQTDKMNTPRLIDEVLPTHAHELLQATRKAAFLGSGLICSLD